MQDAICSLGVGKWFPRGVARLEQSLRDVQWKGGVVTWAHDIQWPQGCPSQRQTPFAFKPWWIRHVADQGFRRILWLDSAYWAFKNPQPIFDRLAETEPGVLLWHCGWSVRQWTSDAAIRWFGLSADEAHQIRMIQASMMAFDLDRGGREFLDRWWESRVTFTGAWTNDNHEVSNDPRCLGHRHDQSAASMVAHEMGIDLVIMPDLCAFAHCPPGETTVIIGAGM